MIRNPFGRDLMEDPFFAAHRSHMMSMGSMFPMHDPFAPPQIVDSRMAERERRSRRHRQHQQQLQPANPFSMMSVGLGGMLANMDRMMSDMHRRLEQPLPTSPTGHGSNFVQSSFVSYSSNGRNGSPRVYQSSVSHRARGGVVETKKTERDTATGVEKVVVGHKIGDREHRIERLKNNITGENALNQEYINLDEGEADSFDQEFQDKVRQQMPVRSTDHGRRHRLNPTDNHHHHRPRQILPPRHNRSYRDRS